VSIDIDHKKGQHNNSALLYVLSVWQRVTEYFWMIIQRRINMKRMQFKTTAILTMLCLAVTFASRVSAALPDPLPDPDGKPADMSKPVKVFILMGQSNMLGFGNANQLKGIAGEKYPFLVDDAGNWNVRQDVRNVFFCMGKLRVNDWLSPASGSGKGNIGPEIGIGNILGTLIDEPVLILKSCVGNRALGWDLLPPSAVGTGVGGKSYQGDSESSNRKVKENRDGWYAGLQYDQDVGAAQNALKNLSTYYPGAKGYEVAGFFWWQGNAEKGKGSVENYDKNLAFLFNDLRKDFNAPNAKFVCATLGEHDKNATLSQKMYDFAGRPEFKGQAAVFYSKPVSKGGSSGGHYNKNAETYMNVGLGMGAAMAELLGSSGGGRGSSGASSSGSSSSAPVAMGEMRTWTSQSGSKVDAKLVSMRTYDVVLQKADGTQLKIGRSALSKADQDYLNNL
jgi:hypothetical protein